MPLITLSRARLAYGHQPLLDGIDFEIDRRERVGLIGRNGSGKSSLLQVLARHADVDEGEVWFAPDTRIAYVAQEPDIDERLTVYDAVALGLGGEGRLLADYHRAAALVAESPQSAPLIARLDALQAALDRSGA